MQGGGGTQEFSRKTLGKILHKNFAHRARAGFHIATDSVGTKSEVSVEV